LLSADDPPLKFLWQVREILTTMVHPTNNHY